LLTAIGVASGRRGGFGALAGSEQQQDWQESFQDRQSVWFSPLLRVSA